MVSRVPSCAWSRSRTVPGAMARGPARRSRHPNCLTPRSPWRREAQWRQTYRELFGALRTGQALVGDANGECARTAADVGAAVRGTTGRRLSFWLTAFGRSTLVTSRWDAAAALNGVGRQARRSRKRSRAAIAVPGTAFVPNGPSHRVRQQEFTHDWDAVFVRARSRSRRDALVNDTPRGNSDAGKIVPTFSCARVGEDSIANSHSVPIMLRDTRRERVSEGAKALQVLGPFCRMRHRPNGVEDRPKLVSTRRSYTDRRPWHVTPASMIVFRGP